MKKYTKPAIVIAAMMMGAVSIIGCGNGTQTTTNGTKETQEPTTFAPDLNETKAEAVINGNILVGMNERYQMPLPDTSWKIDSQSEEKVELSSENNTMTIQYLTGDAADEVDIFYNAGEYEGYLQETEELQGYQLVYYKDCAIDGEMDGYVTAVAESGDGTNAKVSAAFGFPNTSDSYVMYTVDATLSSINETSIVSTVEAVSQFSALRSLSSVQTPEEAADKTNQPEELPSQYTDEKGRFEIGLPAGEWTSDESTEGIVTLTNGAQKITVSIAEGEAAAGVLIPESYQEFYANLIPESESGADEQEVLAFYIDAAQDTIMYETRYIDSYVKDVQYVKESRIRKDGTAYTVRAEYTKDAEKAEVEQGMQAVDTFRILK